MKQSVNILRGRLWLWLLAVLFVWLLSQETAARERYPEMTSLYQVMLNGSNKVRIQAPAYDKKDNDYFVYHGYLKAKWKDAKATIQPALGDYFAAFVSEECRSVSSAIDNLSLIVLGCEEGEIITLKYYQAATGKVFTFPDVAKIKQ